MKRFVIVFAFFTIHSIYSDNFYDYLNKLRSQDLNVAEFRVMLTKGVRPDTYDITPRIGIYGPQYQFLNRVILLVFL